MLRVILTLTVLAWTKADLYSSIERLRPLIETHKNVTEQLREYLDTEMERLERLKKFFDSFKREDDKLQAKGYDYIKNPLNAYSLIQRLTFDMLLIEYYTSPSNANRLVKSADAVFPDKDDLDGAAISLWRLQRTYLQNVSMMSQGILEGNFSHKRKNIVEKTSPMSISDCFEVGRALYEHKKDYHAAILWFEEALHKFRNRDPWDSYDYEDESEIIDYLHYASEKAGDYRQAFYWTQKLAELKPDWNLDEELQIYEEHAKTQKNKKYRVSGRIKFKALCRGDISVPAIKTKSLHCYYKNSPAFLQLARVRTEEIYKNPEFLLFHNIISDAEADTIKQLAQNQLYRAKVLFNDGPKPSMNRISQSAWLRDDDSVVVERISQRVEDITGLSTEYAEKLQIANYGIGGNYDPHYDYIGKNRSKSVEKTGNRIATVLFYMTDVELGGATAFTELNLTVFPIKNAAVFWYNSLPGGEIDNRTMHGACPVMLGEKWVFTQWIREAGQEFKKPCPVGYSYHPTDETITLD